MESVDEEVGGELGEGGERGLRLRAGSASFAERDRRRRTRRRADEAKTGKVLASGTKYSIAV